MGADPQDYDTSSAVLALGGELDLADISSVAGLASHLADTVDAHDASAVSADSTTLVGTGTTVQAVLEELDDAVATNLASVASLDLKDTVQVCPASSSNAIALNAALGHVVTLTMTEDTTVTISNMVAGQRLIFVATQHASNAKTLAFASTYFAGGTEPTLSVGASAVDIFTIVKIGSQLYGFVAGQDMKA